MDIILSPPLAFLSYLILVGILSGVGKVLAGRERSTPLKASTYASGEAPPAQTAAPGYRPFFVVALFFAVLHLGVLVVGSGRLTLTTGAYLAGLMVVLAALALEGEPGRQPRDGS